jgi:hypothetical protein
LLETARFAKLPVPEQVRVAHVVFCKLVVALVVRLLHVMLPVPSAEKGYVVPLKTLKPPPLMARKPDTLATTPVEVTASEFTEPALMFVAARS